MNDAREELTRALRVLTGEALWAADVAAGMLMLQFGERRTVVKRSGKEIDVGKVALHVQCPWRLRSSAGVILTGSDDVNIESLEEFCRRAPVVRAAHASVWQLSLIFEGGDLFEVFPATSTSDDHTEFWRILFPWGYSKEQVVVSGRGAEGL